MPFLLEKIALFTRKALLCCLFEKKVDVDSIEMDTDESLLEKETANSNKLIITKSNKIVNVQKVTTTSSSGNQEKTNIICNGNKESLNVKKENEMNLLALNYLAFISLFLFSFTFNCILWFRICFNS